jgi:hydroxymethylpyrimidine/phosphomethylpyrimidine kinase
MVAKSGDRLLDPDAIDTVRRRLLPLASVLTPNLPEAGVLLGRAAPTTLDEMERAAVELAALGARHVLVKGGHLSAPDSPDVLCDGRHVVRLAAPRVATQNTHGTGCTLSAAIATMLAHRQPVSHAVRLARRFVLEAIERAPGFGEGSGPLGHHAVRKP